MDLEIVWDKKGIKITCKSCGKKHNIKGDNSIDSPQIKAFKKSHKCSPVKRAFYW